MKHVILNEHIQIQLNQNKSLPIMNCLSVRFSLASGLSIRIISNCSLRPISSLMIRVRQSSAFERSSSSIRFL